jgi:hypothetical protein
MPTSVKRCGESRKQIDHGARWLAATSAERHPRLLLSAMIAVSILLSAMIAVSILDSHRQHVEM